MNTLYYLWIYDLGRSEGPYIICIYVPEEGQGASIIWEHEGTSPQADLSLVELIGWD